jgi:membrane-bound serine protease (ClpP class)
MKSYISSLFFILLSCCTASLYGEEKHEAPEASIPGRVVLAKVEGAITPVVANFMVEVIEKAEDMEANCILFELDTPGGLDDSMRQIIKKIMASRVPVVIYVAPSGSRAASAGAFITLSAHIAAMAPGTTIGAAHPVTLGGSTSTNEADVSSQKMTEDAAAFIRSIAAQRGRNVEWANNAVKQSVSLHETEALEKKVIDLIAPTTTTLLEQIDGREIELQNGRKVKLRTKDALIKEIKMNWRDSILATIANPNLAYLLFLAGLVGLYFESRRSASWRCWGNLVNSGFLFIQYPISKLCRSAFDPAGCRPFCYGNYGFNSRHTCAWRNNLYVSGLNNAL